jgi:hypothetical protein
LRSLRLGGENAFILLRFFTAKALANQPDFPEATALLTNINQ